MEDEIYSYREMCDLEKVSVLQRGMNFRMNPHYSVILMSQRPNAPYLDKILEDGRTILYEGHDVPKTPNISDPKKLDQQYKTKSGTLTQNGKFIKAVESFKRGENSAEKVKAYEKILPGVWSLKGVFDLVDYEVKNDGNRNVYLYSLKLSELGDVVNDAPIEILHTRLIPSEVKKEVWKRDKGECVLCSSKKNLHFDHDLPFSKGGSSIGANNIRLLCARCNLMKSDKIE